MATEPPMARAIQLMCRQCMGFHTDGPVDCECVGCPLYFWMEHRKLEPDTSWVGATLKELRKRFRQGATGCWEPPESTKSFGGMVGVPISVQGRPELIFEPVGGRKPSGSKEGEIQSQYLL